MQKKIAVNGSVCCVIVFILKVQTGKAFFSLLASLMVVRRVRGGGEVRLMVPHPPVVPDSDRRAARLYQLEEITEAAVGLYPPPPRQKAGSLRSI